MAFASLSSEVRGAQLATKLNLRNDFVSALCDIEPSKLSRAFRCMRELDPAEGVRLTTRLHRLVELQEALSPLSIDLRTPAAAQDALDAFADYSADEVRKKIFILFQLLGP